MGLKDKEKVQAKKMYIVEKLTAKEISNRLGVSEVTLSKWINSEDWRSIKKLPDHKIDEEMNKVAYESVNAIKVLTSFGKYLDNSGQDELSKIVNANIIGFVQTEYSMP